ncbi:MAG: hypothetical protein A2Z16_00455 [Chloroflexi bacterium RBG_16_54_18]|nr:MAG: hypothetical protein A2Z16_00455 [Chloroflexi bacterium RBG_16_54_18]
MTTVFVSLLGILFVVLFLIFSVYAYYQFSGLIVPGVRLGDLSLGGMSLTQASLALHRDWESDLHINVTNGTQAQLVTPSELGLEINEVQTAQTAVDVGRGGSVLAELAMMAVSAKDGWPLDAQIIFDEETGRAGLQRLAEAMSLSPQNASIRLEGSDLVQIPSHVGYQIDIDATLEALNQDPGKVLSTKILQVVPEFVPPEITDATPALAEARRLLDTPTRLTAYDPVSDEQFEWPVPRERLADWLEVTTSEEGIQATLDENQVGQYLTEKAAELGNGRYLDPDRYAGYAAESIRQGGSKPVPVSHSSTEYKIQPGDTLLKIAWRLGFPSWAIIDANPGLNPDALLVGSTLIIPSKDALLPLPAVPHKRIVINISDQKLWVYQDGNQIQKFIISTGIDRSPTQPGIFQVQTHVRNAYASVWDLHMPNFLGIYEAWPGFMNGIHGLPTLSGGRRLWADILGRPASYGCIILDLDDAAWLYDWAENGVVVEIHP